MRTAVITTAHGRTLHLRRQLDGLSRSARLPDVHIVVAIDDPAVSEVVAASGSPAHVVHRENGPGPLAVASARNIGALKALDHNADLLVFLDVDCIPGRNMLGRYHEAVVDPEHRPALLCGPVTYLPPLQDGEGYPVALEHVINPHPARPAPRAGEVIATADYALFWSLSFALTASTWRPTADTAARTLTSRRRHAPPVFQCGGSAGHMPSISSIPCRIPRWNTCTT
jgi:hypothetical protein